MARHQDQPWNLPEGRLEGGTRVHTWESIHAALLMDLRDELRRLRQVFECATFLAIPRTLTEISRNTAKPKKAKGAKR